MDGNMTGINLYYSKLAFKEEQQREETLNPEKINLVYTDSRLTSGESTEPIIESKPKRRSRKTSRPVGDQLTKEGDKLLRPGSTVRVVSGTFTDFAGVLEKLDRKTKRVSRRCHIKHFQFNR